MWYSYYMDGWYSFYIPKADPQETYPAVGNVPWVTPQVVVDPHARGPPIMFGRQ